MEGIDTTAFLQMQKDLLTVQIIVECLVDELIETNVISKETFSVRLDSKIKIITGILDKMKTDAVGLDTLLKSPMASNKVGQA